MKKSLLTLAFVLCSCISAFSQATSLTVDCQNPGWLSNMINYGDQQTLENLKITGYINGTDIKFLRELNLNRKLSGVLDLEDVTIVSGGESYGTFLGTRKPTTKDNTITDFMFAILHPIRKVILPLSTTSFDGAYQFFRTQVDTLIINGSMEKITIGAAYDNKFWETRCIFFPEGLKYINLGYLFHPYAYLSKIELFFPSTIEEFTGNNACTDEETIFHCSSTNPEIIKVTGYTNNNFSFFHQGTIYVPSGTKEKYENSIFSRLTIIEEIPVESISLIKNKSLYVGDKIQLQAQILPTNALNQAVIWQSSNTEVASISEDGLLTAISYGITNITVTTIDGGFTATCKVNVFEHTTGVQMIDNVSMIIGEQYELIAHTLPLSTSDGKIVYSNTNNNVVTVNENGLITALAKGTSTITATSVDGGHTATCVVTVTQPVAVTGIVLNSSSLQFDYIGETANLEATVLPENAANKKVNWTSSNPSVCIVSNGMVVSVGMGTSVVIATTEDGGFMAVCVVTVTSATGISSVEQNDGMMFQIYDINGLKQKQLQKGINIIQFKDGSRRKVLIK